MNGEIPEEDLAEFYCDGHKDCVFCEECFAVFNWDKLPDENVRTYREHHGRPNLTPEIVPVGWDCPACGQYNEL